MVLTALILVFTFLMIVIGIGRAARQCECRWERPPSDMVRTRYSKYGFSKDMYLKKEHEIAAGVTDLQTSAPIQVQYEWLDWEWVVVNGTEPPAERHKAKFTANGMPTEDLITVPVA